MEELKVTQLAEKYGLSGPQAYGAMKMLVQMGLASELSNHRKGGKANKYLVNTEAIDAISSCCRKRGVHRE